MAANWIVLACYTYTLAGVMFGAAFVSMGIGRVDPVAAHATWGFRLVVLPGVAALWPMLLTRWWRAVR